MIKAIETSYKGYRFRSRLEARWAVFFDSLGVKWEYEREGYRLPSGLYLPDFGLPHVESWVEIKGKEPTDLEKQLACELAEATRSRVFIFDGDLPGYSLDWSDFFDKENNTYLPWLNDDDSIVASWDNYYAFCICDECGLVGLEFEGRTDRLDCKECYRCMMERHKQNVSEVRPCPFPKGCHKRCRRSSHGDKYCSIDHPRIVAAIRAAHSARFEHGEKP